MGLQIVDVNGVNHGVCICGAVIEQPRPGQDSCSTSCPGLVKPKGKKRSDSATLQECVASALPYQSKTQWRDAVPRFYHRADRQDWMPYCTSHMTVTGNSARKPPISYLATSNDCLEDALNYKSRDQWKRNSRGYYNWARKNGVYDDMVKHMVNVSPAPVCLVSADGVSYEQVFVSASQFSNEEEWKKFDPQSYNAAIKYRWDICFQHMPKSDNELQQQKRCLNSAQKYRSFYQWKQDEKYYFRLARIKGWMFYCLLQVDFADSPYPADLILRYFHLARSRDSYEHWISEGGLSVKVAKDLGLMEMFQYGLQ